MGKARGGPAASLPAADPSRSSPAGKVKAQQQQELETMCSRLQRQVGEMEVRDPAPHSCRPAGPGPGAPVWVPLPYAPRFPPQH